MNLGANFLELHQCEVRRNREIRSSTSQNSFNANFGESPKGEVRRIHLLGSWVNKGKKEGRVLLGFAPSRSPRRLPHWGWRDRLRCPALAHRLLCHSLYFG